MLMRKTSKMARVIDLHVYGQDQTIALKREKRMEKKQHGKKILGARGKCDNSAG